MRHLVLACSSALFFSACGDDDSNVTGDDSSSTGGDDGDDDDADDDVADDDDSDPDDGSSSAGTDPDGSSTDPTDATESSTTDDPTDATESSSSTDPTDATESSSSTDPSESSSSDAGESTTDTDVEAMCLETTDNCNAPADDCICVGCNDGDGACGLDDDCVCADCDADGFCGSPTSCNFDGVCDVYNEGCACTDCYAVDLCADNPQCGDDVIEGSEECEGDNLNGADCTTLGFEGGELACGGDCQFDTSACTGGWQCDPDYFGTGDGCDCGCGILDPDCGGNDPTLCQYCDDAGSCGVPGLGCPNIIDQEDIALCDALDYWTCEDGLYGDGTCNCGCGVPDSDCVDTSAAACEVCNDEGSCDGDGDCADIDDTNNGECVPAEWTCFDGYYGVDDGCDCGCGAQDPDCADATVGSCLYCNDAGSCNTEACPGTIDPVNNATCTP